MAEISYVTIGWEGVTVEIPSTWSMVGFYSEKKGGYLRVDSPVESVLEMKWSPKGKKHVDLAKTVHSFIDKLKKPLVKKNKKLEFQRDVREEKDGAVEFSWHIGEKNGRGRIAVCPVCGKVVLLHIYYSKAECRAQTLNHILGSVKDHSDNGLLRYCFYGLDFCLPPGFKYKKPVLMSAYISLTFTRRFETVVIESRNLAGSLIKNKTLEEWYREDIAPDLKAYALDYTPGLLGEDPCCSVEGRPAGLLGFLMRFLFFWRTPARLRGLAWHDRERNAIYTIRHMFNTDNSLLETVRDSMTEAGL